MADALKLLVWKAYAVAVACKHSHLDSCLQKANALSLLIWKAYVLHLEYFKYVATLERGTKG